jgi:5-methylcytosine-specific restriction endonuclease McrA
MSVRPKVAAEVFTRDKWMCHWCTYPVVFAPALKYLQEDVTRRCNVPLVYYHFNFARLYAPLLNDLAAVIDHVKAGSKDGPNDLDNLVTACNRCNTLKSNLDQAVWQKLIEEFRELRSLQSRTREMPTEWDGFATIFLLALREDASAASSSELEWFEALSRLSPLTSPSTSGHGADRPGSRA